VVDRVVSAAFDSNQVRVMVCRECGHVAMPENLFDYSKITSETQFELAKRVGTEAVPGREFGMTTMAIDILRRSGLTVLMYGVGRSVDNIHVQKLPKVSRVAIGDVMSQAGDGAVRHRRRQRGYRTLRVPDGRISPAAKLPGR
jgi:hypothetical protein